MRDLRKSCDVIKILKEKPSQAVILASTAGRLESVIKKSNFLTALSFFVLFRESPSPIYVLLDQYCELTLSERVNLLWILHHILESWYIFDIVRIYHI